MKHLRLWRRRLGLIDELWLVVDESYTSPVHIEVKVLFGYLSLLFVLGVVEHLICPALDQLLNVDDWNSF